MPLKGENTKGSVIFMSTPSQKGNAMAFKHLQQLPPPSIPAFFPHQNMVCSQSLHHRQQTLFQRATNATVGNNLPQL